MLTAKISWPAMMTRNQNWTDAFRVERAMGSHRVAAVCGMVVLMARLPARLAVDDGVMTGLGGALQRACQGSRDGWPQKNRDH
jgi:hypothetical protein